MNISKFFKRLFKRKPKIDPYTLVCPTCLGNCGQCGITGIEPTIKDGHWIYYKDLKKHRDYKQGWTSLISSFKK